MTPHHPAGPSSRHLGGRSPGYSVAGGYSLVLALVIVAPLLSPGYLLLRDAVSTPRSWLSDAALGLSEAAPRALPQDFLIAVASHLVDGGVVVKALLLAGLWLAGWGAARLSATVLPDAGPAGQLVAATLTIWNPYVAERLLQGHWSLLVGYGALPWVATTMLRMRAGPPGRPTARQGWACAFWVALAGLTPTGLMLAATVALTCALAPGCGWPRWLCAAWAALTATVAALPWLVAAALGGSLSTATRPDAGAAGVAAFAARAEPGLGTLGSLASLGGIWNSAAVPSSRTTAFAVVAAAVLGAVVVAGLPVVVRRPAAVPLLGLAALAVILPAVAATGPGRAAVQAMIDAAGGLGVLRDGQKWVALAVPGYALAGAATVLVLRPRIPAAGAALACCAAVLLVLPDLAWGVGGKVVAVHYPPGWAAAAALINADPRPVAVLPAGSMRRFGWSGQAPVLDPLPRWIRADVLATGDLAISGRTVPGEGSRARHVVGALLAGADQQTLARAGVGWVVLESGSPGDTGSAILDRLPVAYHDSELTVYRIGGDAPGASRGRRGALVAAHLAWLTMLVAGAVGMAVSRYRPRRAR